MRRFLRYVRIAFSATCLIACVVLIVLWVRSYSWRDDVNGYVRESPLPDSRWMIANSVSLTSCCGHVFIKAGESVAVPIAPQYRWRLHSSKPNEFCPMASWAFNYSPSLGVLEASAPYWFHALVVSAAGAVLWIGRFKRFSLRTLLIATTLVAVVLGAIVWLR
jgi:hypothetical protein